MRVWLVSDLVVLLLIANAAPVIASLLFGHHGDWPVDGKRCWRDQRRLLGPSKTIRGVIAAVLMTALVAPLLNLTWLQGASFGLLAMAGDLASSFVKRRLGFASSQSVPLLDQVPETLLPLWVMQPAMAIAAREIVAAMAVFLVLDLLLSRLVRRPAPP